MIAASTSLTFTLRMPPRELSPNARAHWRVKAAATKSYRLAGYLAGCRVLASERPGWVEAVAQVTFWLPDRRRRDRDNLAASLKAAFDGLVDAGILADDAGLHHAPLRLEVDARWPRVEITITPRGEQPTH
jgi:crossover junction endodeoxyribonuclease RusA